MKFFSLNQVAIVTVFAGGHVSAIECQKFSSLYTGGKQLCETMWSDAFRYVPVNDPEYAFAYTMWFFEQQNPNDLVTSKRNNDSLYTLNDYNDTNTCHVEGFEGDKGAPAPEPDNFTECHPWRDNSCCYHEHVESADHLNNLYGDEYRWDRCGQMSPECARFFVQEACFYECDVNVGFFRAHTPDDFDPNNESHNKWQIVNMPIKGDYCDSFYEACKNDYFCASSGGNFFECAKDVVSEQSVEPVNSSDRLSPGIIALICVLSVAVVIAVLIGAFLVIRERKGKPVFKPLIEDDVVQSQLNDRSNIPLRNNKSGPEIVSPDNPIDIHQ